MADPNKWLGLLKWSMKYQDGTSASPAKEMSKEDRDFLETVLKEAVMDETERIQQILRVCKGEHPSLVFAKEGETPKQVEASEEELADYREALLDELLVRIDQIDNAKNFVKMDGLQVMMALLQESPRADTRALAAEVCSVVVQNNPFCQDAAVKAGLLEVLCELTHDSDTTCRVKALLALSCLVRNHAVAEAHFLSASCNGVAVLQRFLQQGDDIRLLRKSLFFMRYLIRNSSSTAEKLLKDATSYLTAVAGFIDHEDVDLCESALQAVSEFAGIGAEYLAVCKQPELGLVAHLSDRIAQVEALDAEEDKESASEILRMAIELRDLLTA